MNARRLKKLLRIGEDIIARRQPMGFGAERFDCGSYACWGGYYCRATRGGAKMRNLNTLANHFGITFYQCEQLLGLAHLSGAPDEANVPGPEAMAELHVRLLRLRSMLVSQKEGG